MIRRHHTRKNYTDVAALLVQQHKQHMWLVLLTTTCS